jgi:conjugal transfer pilus assembly protein TraI
MFRHRLLDQTSRLLGILKPRPAPAPPGPPPALPASLSVQAVLAPHEALVRRIRVAYGYPDDEFRQHLLAPITALAAWLHFLPGHPGGGFERRGGAIEHALTNCLFSLQAADGRTFGSDTEAPTLHGTQRWRLACALGGLFVSLPELLARIEVASDDGHVWPGSAMPLLDWLESLSATKYHYRWAAAQKELAWPAVYAASRCIDPSIMSFFVRGDVRIGAALLSCVAGSDRSAGQVSDVVNKIAAAVAARERPCGTVLPADVLASTLMRLLGTSGWLPNSPGGHVWYGTDGLYLLWPDAAAKLLEAMPHGARGIPAFASHDDLLHHLAASGIVHTSPSPLLHIRPPGHDKPQAAVRVAGACRIEELGWQATPLDLRAHVPVRACPANEGGADEASVGNDRSPRDSPAGARDLDGAGTPAQQPLDFADALDPLEVARGSRAAGSALALDTSSITNPRIRELVDGVFVRLDQSFDSMLSRVVPDGVFVALVEFVGQHGDGASVVRALHDARLLAIDDATPDRRVVSEKIEGVDVVGVVLQASALSGYADWKARWQDDGECPSSELHRSIASCSSSQPRTPAPVSLT